MGVTPVNGNSGTQQTEQTHGPATVSTQSGSPTVGTATGESEPTDGSAPGAETASDGAAGGDIPDPATDPMAYADYLEQKEADYQDLLAYREQLEVLADPYGANDPGAQALISKIDAQLQSMGLGSDHDVDKFEDERDIYADMNSTADFDGDGVMNKDDADFDGDSVTNEAEAANGTKYWSTDSDGDGITDYGELWIKQHNYDYTWMDPNNPDANHNGIIDGKELPTSLTVDNNGQPIIVGGQPSTGTSSTGTTGTSSASLIWGPPSSGAQSAGWGDTVDAGAGDTVINLSGENIEVSTSSDGNDMVVTNKDTGETITVQNYKEGKVYFEGTSGDISTNNFSSGNLTGIDGNGDGYADAGVHFASGMNTASIQNNYDPFNGSMPVDEAASTADETVYNADGGSGTFQVPDSMGGNAVEVAFDGDDVVVTVKDGTNGDAIKSFRLKGAKDEVESGAISFQLGDEGSYFYSEGKVTVHGGKGADMISVGSGSHADGGEGNDYLVAIGTGDGTVLDGGDGDDLLEGGDGVDTLIGGRGYDAAYSGSSTGDTFDMGDGNDIAIVSDTSNTAHYNMNMGAGVDMSNDTNTSEVDENSGASVEVRMDDLDGLSKYLDEQVDGANGDRLEALEKADDIKNMGAQMAADTVKDAFLAYLGKKKGEMETSYGADHGDSFSGDGNVPPPTDPSQTDPTSDQGP